MKDKYLTFYAVMINGQDASLFTTAEDAISELGENFDETGDDTYAIQPIKGIWELLERYGAFENYSDDWLLDILPVVVSMAEDVKKALKNEEDPRNEREE